MTERDLDRLWESDTARRVPQPALENEIASLLVRDLTPVRPLPSAVFFVAAFALIVLVLAVLGGAIGGAHALPRMNGAASSITFASLALSVVLLAYALAAQMVPGSRQVARPWVLSLAILAGLAIVFAVLFSYRHELHFWVHAWNCLSSGMIAGGVSALLIWIVLRRGAVLDSRSCGALAGLLGGLTGAVILELDCFDFNVAHILLGHWTVALLSAGIGWLAGGIASRRT